MKQVHKGKAVLYVDDEPSNLLSFRTIFRRHFSVYTASSGKEGLEIIRKHPIQLIISDQRMPEMTGSELLKHVADLCPDIIRILMTGYSDNEAIIEAINHGKIHKYLTKPWDAKKLRDTIEEALGTYELGEQKILQLQNLQKVNTELDRFVYSSSHDLRAPIASLLGLINLAKRTDDVQEIKELLGIGERVLAQLNTFIKEIADYSRNVKTGIQSQEIDFKSFFNDILAHYQFYEDSQKIQKIIEVEQNHSFRSDIARLKIIFKNLVSNAIQYASFVNREPFLKITAQVTEKEVFIEISDNGQGIAPQHLEKIFDMFYRATDAKTGSGLGLFIVKETVEKLHGSIEVNSDYGFGTTFNLRFPVIPADQEHGK